MTVQTGQEQVAPVAGQPGVIIPTTPATAAEMYEAMRAQARVLNDQLQSLEQARSRLSEQLRNDQVTGADRAGLEARLTQLDGRIAQIEAQRLVADAQVAQAAAQPGAVIEPPPPVERFPEEVFAFGAFVVLLVAFPLAIAWARRLWRRQTVIQAMPVELGDRLTTIERSVEAVAIEVERIGEGQRFVTQLLASRRDSAERALADPNQRNPG